MLIELIDISNHQGEVNFAEVHASGQRAVIIKASEGQTYTDPRFDSNWSRVREVEGLLRGAYHFGRAGTNSNDPADAALEARHFCQLLLDRGGFGDGCLPPALDFEWGSAEDDFTWQAHEAWIASWVRTVEDLLGRSPMIYTGRRTWLRRVGYSSAFTHLPLWQADYSGDVAEMPWDGPTIHQWGITGAGSVPGVSTRIDRNTLMGDEDLLASLATPQIYRPDQASGVSCERPWLDLASMPSGDRDEAVASAQGLLMARGLGPNGLVDADGLPDGKPGPKTREALGSFRASVGLSAVPSLDGSTWSHLARYEVPRLS